ncbi:hypothetical protein [Bifidobacterium mongoliense]|uniref:hypothetical protein n=1 Tax=Bifidobacterium mongoliense TaxID=518643 RepID=UPI0030EB3810
MMDDIAVGDELIYRVREYESSERVRVVEIDERKKTPRYVIEFLDGEKAGTRENVPGSRLRGRWADVDRYDALMAHWESLEGYELSEIEEFAVGRVFILLIPEEIAEWLWSPVRWTTRIHDSVGLEKLIGVSAEDMLAQAPGFTLDGDTILSPDGTLRVAQYACRVNPMPVLDWVEQEEKEYQEKCRKGSPAVSWDNKPYTTDPDWEYERYLEDGRPLHELLRSWCGQRAVTLKERAEAAEAEVHRLDMLIENLFDQMKSKGFKQAVEYIEQSYVKERITAYNYRTVVERPLDPSEIPVRVEYRRAPRWWGY